MNFLFRMAAILSFSMLIMLPQVTALAADDAASGPSSTELSNPFSDYVPFEDEYDIDEDERFMYFGRFFGISLGSGLHQFGGNIGRLYNTALPVLDFKMIYFFDFRLAGTFGISSAAHAFNAQPNGAVEVKIMRINADMKYYFDVKNSGAALTAAAPYVVAGLSQTYRTQLFQDGGTIQKDNALAISGGLGLEFALKPRKTSLGVEGRMHQIYFKDRLISEYLPSGVPDTTGPMYSLITSVIFFF